MSLHPHIPQKPCCVTVIEAVIANKLPSERGTSALLMEEHWLGRLLQYGKTWEVRGRNCLIRGKIYLARKSKIYGETQIVDAFPVTMAELDEPSARAKHHIADLTIITYKTPFVWQFAETRRYMRPVNFTRKKGQIVFCSVDFEILRGDTIEVEDEVMANITSTMKSKRDHPISAGVGGGGGCDLPMQQFSAQGQFRIYLENMKMLVALRPRKRTLTKHFEGKNEKERRLQELELAVQALKPLRKLQSLMNPREFQQFLDSSSDFRNHVDAFCVPSRAKDEDLTVNPNVIKQIKELQVILGLECEVEPTGTGGSSAGIGDAVDEVDEVDAVDAVDAESKSWTRWTKSTTRKKRKKRTKSTSDVHVINGRLWQVPAFEEEQEDMPSIFMIGNEALAERRWAFKAIAKRKLKANLLTRKKRDRVEIECKSAEEPRSKKR